MGIIICCCFCSLSCVRLFAAPWTAAHQASLRFTVSQMLPKFMFIKSVMPSNHLILCHPLLLLPSIFPSMRVFSNELVLCIRLTKVLELQLQHQSFQRIFRVDFICQSPASYEAPILEAAGSIMTENLQFQVISPVSFFILCNYAVLPFSELD